MGPISRKSPKLFGPEKPFVKLRPAYSVKLVFSYVVKGIKIKITAKSSASVRLRFEDTKRIMSPEMRPKSFGTFEKQAHGPKTDLVIGRKVLKASPHFHGWQIEQMKPQTDEILHNEQSSLNQLIRY